MENVLPCPRVVTPPPLQVECTKRLGVPEKRWRRWVLQILKLLASHDGSVLDAVLLWKRNVDKEFEGVEVGTRLLPSLCSETNHAAGWVALPHLLLHHRNSQSQPPNVALFDLQHKIPSEMLVQMVRSECEATSFRSSFRSITER